MNCPFCDFEAGPRAMHAHLGEQHGQAVVTVPEGEQARYEITCPHCGAKYQHVVRKGRRDPAFLTEFEREIQLVALDMLVNHLLAEHEPSGTGD
jgi:peptide subunit release factor 1 (eRF1)